MKKIVQNNRLYIIGALTGALSGFLYWKYIGCLSGTCRITSSLVNSTLYFAVLGALVFSLFKRSPAS